MLIGVPLLFELIFVGMLTFLLGQAEKQALSIAHSKAILTKTNTLHKLLIEASGAVAGYSAHKNKEYAENYETAMEQIPIEMQELRDLSRGNKSQEQNLKKIEGSVNRSVSLLNKMKSGIDAGNLANASKSFKELRQITVTLETQLKQFFEEERLIERSSPQMEQRSRALLHTILWLGTALNIVLALFMAHLFYTGITGRLKILTDNAIRLAKNEPLNPTIKGSDEVAYLDSIFHEMANALANAARKERSIIENALDVICSIDENGKFVAVSPASEKVWGYRPEDLIGKRFTELIMVEDIEYTLDCMREIMLEQKRLPFENRIVRRNGTVVNILWSAYWSNDERSMFCVAHDISDRKLAENMLKENEARTRFMIESMPVGLMIVDDQGIIEVINPQMERMFEFSTNDLIGKHVSMLFPKAVEFYPKNYREGAYKRLVGKVREFDAQRKSGEVFPAELSFIIYGTVAGPRLLVNILDVAERHLMEKLKRDFVSTVSHELRTPLTSIRGSLSLLATGALGPMAEQAMRAVKIAERNCFRLINLINDLLDIEKLESGKMEMVFEQVSLQSVFERSVESVRSFADQYGIVIKVQMDRDYFICADGDRVVQALINLISNACKYSPRDEVVLLSAKEEDFHHVKVSVTDKGRGIPKDAMAKIFERFQQVETADAKRRGGSGLGLAICKAIIERHNGKIEVNSELGKGSTFYFILPKWGTEFAPEASEKLKEVELPLDFRDERESDKGDGPRLPQSTNPQIQSKAD